MRRPEKVSPWLLFPTLRIRNPKSVPGTYWVHSLNNHRAFAELTEVYQIESDLAGKVDAQFHAMITT